MIPNGYHTLFGGCAFVAGTLIGPLFVAITVAGERVTADGSQAHRVRASAALTAFTNALVISPFALIPGIRMGWTALVVSVLGLVLALASVLSLLRVETLDGLVHGQLRAYAERQATGGSSVVSPQKRITPLTPPLELARCL